MSIRAVEKKKDTAYKPKRIVSPKEHYELAALVGQGKHHADQVRELRNEIAKRLGLWDEGKDFADIDDLDEIENAFDYNDPLRGLDDLLKTLRVKRSKNLKAV